MYNAIKPNHNYPISSIQKHKFLTLAILTFIGILLYELHIHPSQILPPLFGENRSFAILVKDDEAVMINQKTRFIINQNDIIHQFMYLDYDTGMINGEIDIQSINEITVYQGNRALQMGKTGLMAGFLGGFTFMSLLAANDNAGSEAIQVGLVCGTIDGVALGALGTIVGLTLPNLTTYKVSSNLWQFAEYDDNLILK